MRSENENYKRLLNAIIKRALLDYTRDTSKIKNIKERKIAERQKLEAELFFRDSEVFKMSGHNFEYLLKHKDRILKSEEDE